jgi:hypothetical protein
VGRQPWPLEQRLRSSQRGAGEEGFAGERSDSRRRGRDREEGAAEVASRVRASQPEALAERAAQAYDPAMDRLIAIGLLVPAVAYGLLTLWRRLPLSARRARELQAERMRLSKDLLTSVTNGTLR